MSARGINNESSSLAQVLKATGGLKPKKKVMTTKATKKKF